MSPTFSIIIPVYNVAPYLRECLDSVLAQTYTDWEAICVDDGSNDGSGEILDEYSHRDGRIIVIHKENAGPATARNFGIERARGEWISFLDSDDTVTAEYLSAFVGIEDKADVNFFSVRHVYRDGSVKVVSSCSSGIIDAEANIYSCLSLMAWNMAGEHYLGYSVNKFYRASIIHEYKLRFPDGLRICEDEVFLFRCLEHVKTIRVDPRAPYNYIQREGGLTDARNSPLLDAAELYRALARSSNRAIIRRLSARRVQECCKWKIQLHFVTYFDVRRMYNLLHDQFKFGRNRFARCVYSASMISSELAVLLCFVYIKCGRVPLIDVDWKERFR